MEEPLNIERDVVKNGVRLDCVFEGYEYRPEREEVRSQRLAGFECVEIAENTGLSLEQVTDYCRELGLPETGSCQLQPPDGSRERHCPVCGRILVQRGNSGRRRFCSPECREEYYRQHSEFYQFLLAAFQQMHGHLADDGSIYIFHADTEGLNFRKAFKDAGFYLSGCCIWKKNALVLGRSPYQWQHEPCLYGWKQKGKHQWYSDRKQTTIWEYDRPKSNKDHPTMKPIGLMSYPIRNSTMTNGIVLDPFLGSGSTLIACEETDRVCRGIELDPKFVDVIVKRYIEHSDGHYDDVFVVRDGQKLKFEEVATFEPEKEVADGE